MFIGLDLVIYMGSELLFVLLPGGALFGAGAAWVVYRASAGRSIWVRLSWVFLVLFGCSIAPLLFFMLLGGIASYTQPVIKATALEPAHPVTISSACSTPLRPNPSLKRSANGRPPRPGRWYGVNFHRPGRGGLPLAPA